MREPTAGTFETLAEGLAAHGFNIGELRTIMTLGNAEAIEMSVEAGIGVARVRLRPGQCGHSPVAGGVNRLSVIVDSEYQ